MPGPFHGLPPKPQAQPLAQAGPSKPPGLQHHRPAAPYQPPVQYPYPYPQQQQIPGNAYYPYGYQNNPSGGYQPYAAYYQQAAQPYQPYQAGYAYPYAPTATPEGYSYSATYAPTGHAPDEPQSKKPRVHAPMVVPTAPIAPVVSVKPWRNCSHPGCKYVGSGEDVETHEGDRHLIFPNGRRVERSEEEEKWASHKGPPPPIEGTGIVLQTDEDVEKWVAERRAKWPSAKRLAEREEERRAAIARGENPDGGRGRGRGGSRGGSKRSNPAAMAEDWGRPALDVQPREQSNRGGARGRGDRGRGRGRGRGRDQDQGYGARAHPSTMSITDTSTAKGVDTVPAPTDEMPAGLPLGGYQSEDDDGSESDSSTESSSSSEEDVPLAPIPAPVAEAVKPAGPVCRTFAKTGRCKFGQKCRFSHTIDGKPQEIVKQSRAPQGPKQPLPKRANPFERPSMLGALLAQPIQNTLSQLTQTIRFLVANDMLQRVELNPGDAEERAREAGKISMVVESDDIEMSLTEESNAIAVIEDPVLDSQ